jgi:hypothetical protein
MSFSRGLRLSLVWIGLLLVVALASGCAPSEKPTPAPAPEAGPVSAYIPTQAMLEQFRAEGPEPTLRKLSATSYRLHYRVMQATGLEKELGGEQQAIDALKALGEGYEKQAREYEVEAPKLIKAADFNGEGMSSGFIGMGMGGFAGLLTGFMTSGAISAMSDAQLEEFRSKGPLKFEGAGGKGELKIAQDGSVSQAMEFNVNEAGVAGHVKVKTRMTACPDPNGRLEVEIDVDSQMSVPGKPGVGGYVHSTFKYERYLDDNANLISSNEGAAASNRIRMGGTESAGKQYVDLTIGYDRAGKGSWDVNDSGGFGIFVLREKDVERTNKLAEGVFELMQLIGEVMVRGIGSEAPWASGRCIDLKVTSTPAKRTGLDPATPFQIEAKPRVKADGSPAQGTVKAKLSGGSKLTLDGIALKADSTHSYVGPEEKEQVASIAFESRSRRGIGKAELSFDTKNRKRAYSISGGADEFQGAGQACDLEEEFAVQGSGVTVRFVPASAAGGRYSYSGNMSGFAVWGNGTYTVNYQGDVAVSITSTGPGSVKTPKGTFSRTGSETYALTPLGDGPCVGATD